MRQCLGGGVPSAAPFLNKKLMSKSILGQRMQLGSKNPGMRLLGGETLGISHTRGAERFVGQGFALVQLTPHGESHLFIQIIIWN